MFLGYRSNDPVITICQDNAQRSCIITEINQQAEEFLGYTATTMQGMTLASLLPERIRALLQEYVEYETEGNDVSAVLGKVQSFCMLDKEGNEMAFRLKVLRSPSLDGKDYFKLILQNGQGNRRSEAFRSILRENFKGHEVLDASTGLPDRYSLTKDIDLALFYVHKGDLTASLAVLDLDKYQEIMEKYGEQTVLDMLKHIAAIAKQNLRPDDTIGCLLPRRIGLILLDTNLESARMVLNRLRWLIAANPFTLPDKTTQALTVSIAFAPLGGRPNDKEVIEDAEVFLNRLQPLGNGLHEVPEMSIRQGGERRKIRIPISPDRRKASRRKQDGA